MSVLIRFYDYVINDLGDPRTKDWPLVDKPWGFVSIIALYLITIYILIPAFMKNRRPYNLRRVIAFYNISQVVACSVLVYYTLTSGWTTHYTLGCQPADFTRDALAMRMAHVVWWTMVLKLIEFAETIFFALRKKNNQITGLHVYHHTSTFFIGWLAIKYYPGGMITFTTVLNSCVHILMYFYYYLTSLGPEMQRKVAPFKRKLTMIQIIQLIIIFVHSFQPLAPSCPVPTIYTIIYAPALLINIVLFLKFYRRAYMNKKNK